MADEPSTCACDGQTLLEIHTPEDCYDRRDVDEYNRDERIETYYQGWGAREMAARIVELEDELGADIDGVCTGMHADVAEARAEVERLTKELKEAKADSAYFAGWADGNGRRLNAMTADRDRALLAWQSARRRAGRMFGAWKAARYASDLWRQNSRDSGDHAREVLWHLDERSRESVRYRLAWLSARRRAADEANFGMEALALRDAEIARLRAELEQRQTFDARLALVGSDEDGEVWVSNIVGKKIRRHPNI
ncbi:hypothetical protein J3S85_37745 [Streptomyces lavenduligriseus]|nr:hypothetical protein J3S85_37745 [Streptomyces lavenduligriseus]